MVFPDEATVRPAPAAKLKEEVVMPLIETAAPDAQVVVETVPEAFTVRQLFPAVPSAERTTDDAKFEVPLNVCGAVHVTELAAVTKPGFTNASVLPEKERFAPIKADCKVPEASELMIEEVTEESCVDELKVAVAFQNCAAVQVTEDAAATKPGFTNEYVMVGPAEVETDRSDPPAKVNWVDDMPLMMVVEAPPPEEPQSEPVPESTPFIVCKHWVPEMNENTVLELNVAVALKLASRLKFCAAVHVTDDAAVTKPGFANPIAPVEVLKVMGDAPENAA